MMTTCAERGAISAPTAVPAARGRDVNDIDSADLCPPCLTARPNQHDNSRCESCTAR